MDSGKIKLNFSTIIHQLSYVNAMNKNIFLFGILGFYFMFQFQTTSAQVYINQAGYLPRLPKIFYTSVSADSFYVIESSTSIIKYRDELYFSVANDPATGLTLYAGDQAVAEEKYIVLWKKEDGRWKLFRDIFNSNLPAKQ